MTQFRKLNKTITKLITGAGVLALIAGANLAITPPAFADDCLLDTNNDGDADSNVDTDGGADSGGFEFNLACGHDAIATSSSIALGFLSIATGLTSTALGNDARATGFTSTAVGSGTGSGSFTSATGNQSTAVGSFATAAGDFSTAVGSSASATGLDSTALGTDSSAAGGDSTALGRSASAAGSDSTALGYSANAGGDFSIALGNSASAGGGNSTALGHSASAAGVRSISIGFGSDSGVNAVALGGDSSDFNQNGAQALGAGSVVIGTDARDNSFAGTVLLGLAVSATEADQVILKSADTFTILGNGDVGIGTAVPLGNLDINSGAADTTLLLNNTSAQWELKSKASTGRLNFKNLTDGGVPFKLGPSAVNSLLSVGTMANDLVEVRGELMVEGDVDVTGTLTTGGPTCGGGCDAVFGADYDLPSIEEHAAQMFANKHLPAVGPTIPLAPVNVSERMGTMLNELEKAHIYIAQQEARLNRHEQEKQAMQADMALMKQQIALLMNP